MLPAIPSQFRSVVGPLRTEAFVPRSQLLGGRPQCLVFLGEPIVDSDGVAGFRAAVDDAFLSERIERL